MCPLATIRLKLTLGSLAQLLGILVAPVAPVGNHKAYAGLASALRTCPLSSAPKRPPSGSASLEPPPRGPDACANQQWGKRASAHTPGTASVGLRPFPPREGGLRLVRTRHGGGRGLAAPGAGSRERPARNLVAPPPCPRPPGLQLQRQPRTGLFCGGGGGSSASPPGPLRAPRPGSAATLSLAARAPA